MSDIFNSSRDRILGLTIYASFNMRFLVWISFTLKYVVSLIKWSLAYIVVL